MIKNIFKFNNSYSFFSGKVIHFGNNTYNSHYFQQNGWKCSVIDNRIIHTPIAASSANRNGYITLWLNTRYCYPHITVLNYL